MAVRSAEPKAGRCALVLVAIATFVLASISPRSAWAALPPGHPSVASSAQLPTAAPKDLSEVDPSLAAGTLLVQARDQTGEPLPGAKVTLKITPRSSTAAARPRDTIVRADNEGLARFVGLDTGGDTSYEVSVSSASPSATDATYGTDPFALDPRHGQRVRLHVYPVTNRLEDVQIGMQGMVYLELGDDALGVTLFLQVFNLGRVTWKPLDFVVDLPEGYASLRTGGDAMKPGFDEVDGRGVRMRGLFGPGQHDINVHFELPYAAGGSSILSMTLPPHVGRLRIVSEAAPGMRLSIAGFPDPEIDHDRSGRRILVADREIGKGDAPFGRLSIALSGIPTSSHGAPWFASIAAVIMLAGIVLAYRMHRVRPGSSDLVQARSRIVEEIISLDDVHARGAIGAVAYNRLRHTLLDALGQVLEGNEK
jgi:hypothetical protein